MARLAVVTEFKTCITDTEVDLHRMHTFQDLNFGRMALKRVKLCEGFLDEYGPIEPDESKSQILGEMKLFTYGYRKHVQEMVLTGLKITTADTRLFNEPNSENLQTLIALEEKQLEGFVECQKFVDKLQALVREAID